MGYSMRGNFCFIALNTLEIREMSQLINWLQFGSMKSCHHGIFDNWQFTLGCVDFIQLQGKMLQYSKFEHISIIDGSLEFRIHLGVEFLIIQHDMSVGKCLENRNSYWNIFVGAYNKRCEWNFFWRYMTVLYYVIIKRSIWKLIMAN